MSLNDHEIAGASDEKSGNDDSPWGESYQKSVPPFKGIIENDSQRVENNNSQERLDRHSAELMRGFLGENDFNPRKHFGEIQEYVRTRSESLGVEKPVKLFLRYEYFEKTPTGTARQKLRFDPEKKQIYQDGNWGWSTRAYHSDKEGTFLDFSATPNMESEKGVQEQSGILSGYEQVYEIINFAYTCEHELEHDIQDQRLEKKEISYDALCTARDRVVINHLLPHLPGGMNFYHNAHDDFYIEDDANKTASEFLYGIISPDSVIGRKIANPNDLPQYQRTISDVLFLREKEGQTYHEEYPFSIGKNEIGLPEKEYRGSAEEIVSDILDDALKVYPDFIKLYPVLSLEYNKDGSRRSTDDIQADIDKAVGNTKLTISGQTVDSKKLKITYNRMMRHFKKYLKR